MLICLLVSTVEVSARPSDAAKSKQTISSSDHRVDLAPLSHHNRKRSAEENDYGDYFDDEYLHIRRCYEDVGIIAEKARMCFSGSTPSSWSILCVICILIPLQEDVNELCQRCSKVTKSAIVFPMCCSNEDDTMDWCKAYVYYGIQN